MKLPIITDTHFGARNSTKVIADYQKKFLDEQFFPYLIENKIKRFLHLGDFFDNRKTLSIKMLRNVRQSFMEKLVEHDIVMDLIPGNHDATYRQSNFLTSIEEILQFYPDNINIHHNPTIVNYDGLDIALIPWINSENYDEIVDFLRTAKAPILGGHLELVGFEMIKGTPLSTHGMDSKLFDRFEAVYTGHYHTKSHRENIHYLGSPYEMTWSDANDPKFFHVLDTETRDLEGIRNFAKLFNKLSYDDALSGPFDTDYSQYTDTFVKVIVRNKTDLVKFDRFISRLTDANPYDLKIIESFEEYLSDSVDDDKIEASDTPTLLNSYIDNIETNLDAEKLKVKMRDLFVEAQNLDHV